MCEIIRGEMCEGRNVPLDLRGAKYVWGEICVGRNVGHSFLYTTDNPKHTFSSLLLSEFSVLLAQ